MKLTPIDIQQHQFRRVLRGFDSREVSAFLELVAQQLAELTRYNTEIRNELRTTRRELEEHRDREATLREAMLTAQRAIDEIREQAQKQAELTISEADLRAERLVMDAHRKVTAVTDDIQDLKRQRARAVAELRGLLDTHTKILAVQEESIQSEGQAAPEATVRVLDRVRPPPPPRLEELSPTGSGTAR